ncbi:D-alanyl-D-alanine carboxypeptidase [Rhodospirillaceae bacterium]|nr:D-alanyl-D-alanine carboxypeptidase [Rhodospirillaceae bacterium]
MIGEYFKKSAIREAAPSSKRLSKVILSLLFFSLGVVSIPSLAKAKYASLVIDAGTGIELYSRNADTKNYPASLTKIMTLYMVFDALDRRKWNLKTRLKVSRRASRQPQTRLGLKVGQTISVHNAILALVTRSANDVATVVAENMAGTEIEFAKLMTKKAKAIGMRRTSFRNASGLPNRGQLSTARDMVQLAIAIKRDFPEFYRYFKTKKFRYRGRTFRNHNMLLGRYTGTDGIKTGYTNASGYNLVASVKRNGRHLIGVVFGGKSGKRRDRHMVRLLDKSFVTAIRLAKFKPPKPMINPKYKIAAIVRKSLNRSDKKENWGIQVGAYSSAKPAHSVIKLAKTYLTLTKKHALSKVERVKRPHGTIFRARVIGLEESVARDACTILINKHLPCVPVPADVEMAEVPLKK